MKTLIIAFGSLLLVISLLTSSLYVVREGKQALVFRWQGIVGEPILDAGLKFKVPFIEDVRFYEKRILAWDGPDFAVPTSDRKYIIVDTTARWRISNVVLFVKSVIDENIAHAKLNGIIGGVTRDLISGQNLVELIRNTNNIRKIDPDIEPIKIGREKLSRMIMLEAQRSLEQFGIELIDVQLRRIAYEPTVEGKVFDRMISERQQAATKIRAIGLGEKSKIMGRMNKDLEEIKSEAYRKSQVIRGKAEAEAINIYAKSMKADPDFYGFFRNLEAYENTFNKSSSLILSTNTDFFRVLQSALPGKH